MLIVLILAPLALPPDDAPKPRPRPAAMLLDLTGKVEIRPVDGPPKVAEPGDLLYPGERLSVPTDGSATLSILGAGARETIKPGTEATVGPKGCTPPGSVAGSEGAPSGRGRDDEEPPARPRRRPQGGRRLPVRPRPAPRRSRRSSAPP